MRVRMNTVFYLYRSKVTPRRRRGQPSMDFTALVAPCFFDSPPSRLRHCCCVFTTPYPRARHHLRQHRLRHRRRRLNGARRVSPQPHYHLVRRVLRVCRRNCCMFAFAVLRWTGEKRKHRHRADGHEEIFAVSTDNPKLKRFRSSFADCDNFWRNAFTVRHHQLQLLRTEPCTQWTLRVKVSSLDFFVDDPVVRSRDQPTDVAVCGLNAKASERCQRSYSSIQPPASVCQSVNAIFPRCLYSLYLTVHL